MTKTYKRALSKAQAASCENANHPRCRCRCQGALHGKGHADYQAREREVLDQQKELNSEQIAELISLSNPANDANPAKSWRDPGTMAVQGRLPLEAASVKVSIA